MKYYSIPPKDGVYRVRLYGDDDAYWEYKPGSNSGVALKPLKKSSDSQRVAICVDHDTLHVF